jgi:hypothetical protein
MAADSGASRHIAQGDMKLLYAAATDENFRNALIASHDNGDNLSFCFSDTFEKIHIMQNGIVVSDGGA